MPEPSTRQRYQRARRPGEKAERRAAILAAAEALFPAVGFEGFTMAVLAKKSGIAKATLYVYFETREEVLLTLYLQRLEVFCDALTAELREGMTDEAFALCFQTLLEADPTYPALHGRLESVIEHNVSAERLFEAKRVMRSRLGALVPRIEEVLGLPKRSGNLLLGALVGLSLGTAQTKLGPTIEALDPPPDIAEFMRLYTEVDVFRATAPMIIAGIRAETQP